MNERNWAGNYTFRALRLHRPESVDEVRRIVAGASRVRALGSRHSFNAVADSPGDLVDLSGIAPSFEINRERRTVTFGAGVNYGELAAALHAQGWALFNMPSLPHVTVAGATATGTHGSGDARGTLAADVAALETVTATGDLVVARRGERDFAGKVVSLGALGVVTRLTVDIQPEFEMRQDAFAGLAWEALQSDLDAVTSAGYSVSLITSWSGPTVDRMWIKTALTGDGPAVRSTAHLGVHPAPGMTAHDIPGLNLFGVAGPWLERLPHFRRDVEPGVLGHLQSEYMVPRDRAVEAIGMLRSIGARIDEHLLASEIRSMMADDLWLSPAYGHAAIAFHFSWQPEVEAVERITAEIEDMLLPLGGRPHWGKIMHAGHEALAPLFPRLQDFRELARSCDPEAKFRNEFLHRHVLGV